MNVHKTCQLKDIPTKVIKLNADIFTNFICIHFNYCIDIGWFSYAFKHADVTPYTRRKIKMIKLITDLQAYYQAFLKFTINCMIILIRYFSRVNVDSEKAIVLGIAH